ncbi:MAG: hypothetical protein ABIX01_19465 [Chitinophagaceae bacterium]
METSTQTKPASKNGAVNTILLAGLVAGTMDITAALTQFYIKTSKDPMIVLRYVASAILGKTAATGGLPVALFGLFLHYVIAFSFVIFYFFLSSKIRWLWKNPVPAGLCYGIFTWTVMNLIVVPVSRIGSTPFDLSKAVVAALILVCCIGMPTAIIVGKYYRREQASLYFQA